MIVAALAAFMLACLAALYVIIIVGLFQYARGESVIIASPTTSQTLPQKCQQYYNNGTEEWIDCMGVGYK